MNIWAPEAMKQFFTLVLSASPLIAKIREKCKLEIFLPILVKALFEAYRKAGQIISHPNHTGKPTIKKKVLNCLYFMTEATCFMLGCDVVPKRRKTKNDGRNRFLIASQILNDLLMDKQHDLFLSWNTTLGDASILESSNVEHE
ncbi:hypothetical protein ACJX0J_041547, partial [Zea mays]